MKAGLRRKKPAWVAFAVGVFAWLLGDGLIALLHPGRGQMGRFMTYFAFVGPGGSVALGALGLVMRQLMLRHVLQPTNRQVTLVLGALIPSLFNGLFWALVVQGIGWARSQARPLFWAAVVLLGVYWTLLIVAAVHAGVSR